MQIALCCGCAATTMAPKQFIPQKAYTSESGQFIVVHGWKSPVDF